MILKMFECHTKRQEKKEKWKRWRTNQKQTKMADSSSNKSIITLLLSQWLAEWITKHVSTTCYVQETPNKMIEILLK